jgi:hypothetical protein
LSATNEFDVTHYFLARKQMQPLTAPVGTKQTNASEDVAIVQAMLVLIQRPATKTVPVGPYLKTYDGNWGEASKAALAAFQTDKVFVSADGRSSVAVPTATAGVVKPGDASWLKLVANTPAEFADLRVLPGGKTAYLAATDPELRAKVADANAATFTLAFKSKVIACINKMHKLHGIAPGVCREGDRRDFQTQYDLRTGGRGVTNAGPGESNHNFGRAADLGFEGLRWLRNVGTPVTNEDSWLHQLDPKQNAGGQALLFWNALRAVGTSNGVNMFPGPVRDRPHLQDWSDAGVNMGARLADLLTRSGTMRWSAAHGNYSSDLGLGGAQIPVGTAVQIWNNGATVTLKELKKLRADAAAAQKHPTTTSSTAAQVPVSVPVTQADVQAVQKRLRQQFELADANWQAWKPH